MRVVGVIPARGGSKSIPRKNLACVGGRTLLAHAAACAQASRRLGGTILSTDDPEIAAAGEALGLEVPFLRPPALASDTAPMIAVLDDLLDRLDAAGSSPDVLVLLQPTSPFRTPQDVDASVDLLVERQADAVVSVVAVPHNMVPSSQMVLREGRLEPLLEGSPVLRRQDKPVLYARNGPAVLTVRSRTVRSGTFYGGVTVPLVMDRLSSLDIDEPEDLLLAERLYPVWLERRGGQHAAR